MELLRNTPSGSMTVEINVFSVRCSPWCMDRGTPRCHPVEPGPIKDEVIHVEYT